MPNLIDLPPADGEPVHLFLLAGQSGCHGSARMSDLEVDTNPFYADYKDAQSNVWLAMRSEWKIQDEYAQFLIQPMKPGVERQSKFGPEVSMGHRFHARTGKRAMVVKLCSGGTNVQSNWNPDTLNNTWDRENDDGTAAYLENQVMYNKDPDGGDLSTGADFEDFMYIDLVHHVRLVTEQLKNNDIPFHLEAFIWQQGGADKQNTYFQFGGDTARLFAGVRRDIGVPNGVAILPIVDTGAGNTASMRTAKDYAHQLLCRKNVVYTAFGTGWQDELSIPDCVQGVRTSWCPAFVNFTLMNEIGWEEDVLQAKMYDLNNPNETYKLNDYTQAVNPKPFAWYSNFPEDQHAAYELIFLQGILFMDTFLHEFTMSKHQPVPSHLLYPQGLHQYTTPKCPEDVYATAEHICWTDSRSPAERESDRPAVCPDYGSQPTDSEEGSGRSLAIELNALGFVLVFTMHAELL